MMKLSKLKLGSRGSILLPLIIVLPFLILIIAHYLDLSVTNYRLARNDQFHTQAQFAADAGADYAMGQIALDENWTGSGSEVTLHTDSDTKTTYHATVTNNSADSKTLTVTGRTYKPAASSTAKTSVKISVGLRPVRSGNYSVVTGQGGLTMSNNSKVTGGDVFINGEIDMTNSAQIGLTTKSANVSVANQLCPIPANATYPRLCNSGENNNPITFSNSAHIYGDVKANYQTSSAGMSGPGLTASSGVTPQPLPDYDRAGQKAAVSTTITGASASCNSGTKTWAANTKITGNVSVSNSCKVTIAGNVWITGNLDLSNSAQIIVSSSAGSTRPVVMVDGSGGANLSNGTKILSNSSGTGIEIITFYSTASCSPDCTNVTGTDLYNSRNIQTISLSNNSEGAETIFYSRWTKVNLANGGQIGAVVGQTIAMSNSATITFGSEIPGLASTTWVISDYRRSFN